MELVELTLARRQLHLRREEMGGMPPGCVSYLTSLDGHIISGLWALRRGAGGSLDTTTPPPIFFFSRECPVLVRPEAHQALDQAHHHPRDLATLAERLDDARSPPPVYR